MTTWKDNFFAGDNYRRMKITGLHYDTGYNGLCCPILYSRILECEDVLTNETHIVRRPHDLWVWSLAARGIADNVSFTLGELAYFTWSSQAFVKHDLNGVETKFVHNFCMGKPHKFTNGQRVDLSGYFGLLTGGPLKFYKFGVSGDDSTLELYDPSAEDWPTTTTGSPTTTTTGSPTTTTAGPTTTTTTASPTYASSERRGYFVNITSCNWI